MEAKMSANQRKLIKEFTSITGATNETAKHFLDACSDNLETAVAMFLDDKTENPGVDVPAKSASGEEVVRAPIPQTSGVLVDDPHYLTTSRDRWSSRRRPRSVFDGFRDFKAETVQQESLLSSNPEKNRRLKRLEDLFRPPLELMHKGNLETARESGQQLKKWLMINVQNIREFSCQVLNRDVWSKPSVQSLMKRHFIFWQVYMDSAEGERFMLFYPVKTWPHVSILDPRTGERLAEWNEINTNNIEGKVAEFLADHGTMSEDEMINAPPNKKSKLDHSLIDDSEDTQLAAAIAASLAESKSPVSTEISGEFTASDQGSDVSGFEGSSDEDIEVSDTENISKKTETSAKNNGQYSVEDTKVDETYFSTENGEKTVKNGEKSHKNTEKYAKASKISGKNTESANENDSDDLKTNKKETLISKMDKSSKKSAFKKVNSKLKVGTLENGKDMSNLTNDIYGEGSKTQKVQENIEMCRIMVRFPDGSKEELQLPSHLTVKDLSTELTKKGYSPQDYDVVTNFPRKSIFSSGEDTNLKAAGLFPRAAVFVQEIES